MSIKRPFTRDQRITIIYGMLAFILILVILQLWLLTATMNAFLGGDSEVIWPAAGAAVDRRFCGQYRGRTIPRDTDSEPRLP